MGCFGEILTGLRMYICTSRETRKGALAHRAEYLKLVACSSVIGRRLATVLFSAYITKYLHTSHPRIICPLQLQGRV